MTIRLLLQANTYSERGDNVNARGQARALKETFGIDSLLTYPINEPTNNPKIVDKMKSEGFWVEGYSSQSELHEIGHQEGGYSCIFHE